MKFSRPRWLNLAAWPPRRVVGWLGVGSSTVAASFWAWWGAIEAFHEGWYYPDLPRNVGLTLVQYLGWMFVPMLAGLLGVWRPWVGASAHVALGVGAFWLFGAGSVGARLIAVPLFALSVLYAFGSPAPRAFAARCLVLVPVICALTAGAYPGWRVLTRPAGADTSMRLIEGNGVSLVWAPAGPGWDDDGFPWAEAERRCAHLNETGDALWSARQGIWRLPTVDEAVRSMIWRGRNAGGVWEPRSGRASYRARPDKESPLWNPYSKVIYWWTADEADPERAYRVSYQGGVNAVRKDSKRGYLAARCVREP